MTSAIASHGLDAEVGFLGTGVIHNVIQTAESGNSASDAGRDVLVSENVDADGVCSCGIFANRAEVKSYSGFQKDKRRDKRYYYRKEEHYSAIFRGSLALCEGESEERKRP